jgi:spermidine dehydrogenase
MTRVLAVPRQKASVVSKTLGKQAPSGNNDAMTTNRIDEALGLHRPITRRDFLNGVALAVGGVASGWPVSSIAGPPSVPVPDWAGQTDAANAALHALRSAAPPNIDVATDSGERYDLIVVGAGISGLAAAFLYRQQISGARILLVDSLDQVGGHAARNEFVTATGKRLIGYGGSQALDTPGHWSPAAHQLIRDIGIDLEDFKGWFDTRWADNRGLTNRATFFGKEAWGLDRLVIQGADEKPAQWVPRMPLNPRAQAGLIELLSTPRDYLAGSSRAEKLAVLAEVTYDEFLTRIAGVDPELTRYFNARTQGYFGVGTDATSALDAFAGGLPGFDAMDLGDKAVAAMSPSGRQSMVGQDPYIYHFPDGNASVARALLRALIPSALPGDGVESLVLAQLNRDRLDEAESSVRIRLGTSAVRVQHAGPVASANQVQVTLAGPGGQLRNVLSNQVVLACFSRAIPLICNEMPKEQVDALSDQHKVPLIYGNVLVNNWRAFAKAGVAQISLPGHLFESVAIDMPVSIGQYRFADTLDDPVLLHMPAVVLDRTGASEREQCAAGRTRLYAMRFAQVERQIRETLNRALGAYGFDAEKDIEAITLNRWAHGYAYEYMRPWDRYWPTGPLPIHTARRGWGRIAIANSDAGAFAYVHSAIDQATRAVAELLPQANLPRWHAFPGPDPARIDLV